LYFRHSERSEESLFSFLLGFSVLFVSSVVKSLRFFSLKQTPDRIALPRITHWLRVHYFTGAFMPEQETIRRAERDKQQGKSPSTQAGEFVREEMDHVRQGVHGARSTKQAIAIGLSKARRAGVDLPPPPGKKSSSSRSSKRRSSSKSSRERANSSLRALRREGSASASTAAISRFAKASARKRGSPSRHRAAAKAAQTRSRNRSKRRN
jgi:hypothetical protein